MEREDELLFADDDAMDKGLDQRGILTVETMIIFMESMKMTGQSYVDTHQQTDQQLRYLEQRIADLRKRFTKLPPPNTA